MKKTSLFILLIFNMILAGSLGSQTVISLTFSASYDSVYQALDSIVIENLTRGGDTSLHYPDTVIELDHGISIAEVNGSKDIMILYPPYPNPIKGHTTTKLYLSHKESITIHVTDLSGREVTGYHNTLPEGEHTFSIYTGNESFYILVAETPRERRSMKLISLGRGSESCRIDYTGFNTGFSGFRSLRSGFDWAPGDQLRFTGYATPLQDTAASDTLYDNPSITGLYTFNLKAMPFKPGTVHCNLGNPTEIVEVTNPVTGKIWMDRNMGAIQAATSSTDTNAYGDLYQWGRFADGHQCRTSATTTIKSSTDKPTHGNFILPQTFPADWRNPQNGGLWQGENGINNPCPHGYRLPTDAEYTAEQATWSSNNAAGAFSSTLKLTMAGYRYYYNGAINNIGSNGYYWTSNISNYNGIYMGFKSNAAGIDNGTRATGKTLRCIKD